jgi:cilia- and flagella-associated protein 298
MTLWFSGKEMQRGKLLCDTVGKNEKTTMIVKIQKVCSNQSMKHVNDD